MTKTGQNEDELEYRSQTPSHSLCYNARSSRDNVGYCVSLEEESIGWISIWPLQQIGSKIAVETGLVVVASTASSKGQGDVTLLEARVGLAQAWQRH